MNRQNMSSVSLPVRRYSSARSNLMLMMVFTLVNTVLAALKGDIYFLFSCYAAHMSAVLGREFYDLTGSVPYLLIGLGVALLVLLPYLVCWIQSKKRRGWLIAALVLFAIDTVMLAVDALAMAQASFIMDLVFHIWLLVSLFLGVRAGKAALAEQAAPALEETTFYDASLGGEPDTKCLGQPQEERKYRLIVQAMHGGRTIEVRRSYGLTELVIDGRLYGKWEGVSESSYEIVARVDGPEIATRFLPTGKQTIEVDGEIIAKKQRLY